MDRPVQTVVGADVLLACELCGAVRRDGLARRSLDGRFSTPPVDRTARRAEDDLRSVTPRGLEHADRADDHHLGVLDRALDRDPYVGLGRKGEDRFGPRLIEDVVERLPGGPGGPAGPARG